MRIEGEREENNEHRRMIVKYIEGSRLCLLLEREENKEHLRMIVQSIKEMSQGHAHHTEREEEIKK